MASGSPPLRCAVKTAGQGADDRGLDPQAARFHPARQLRGGAVQLVGGGEHPVEHRAQGRHGLGPRHIVDGKPGLAQPVLRNVAAVQVAQVLGAILQMVEHLQRGAERVGGPPGGAVLAMQIEHVASDRGRGIAAIIHQLGPVRVAVLRASWRNATSNSRAWMSSTPERPRDSRSFTALGEPSARVPISTSSIAFKRVIFCSGRQAGTVGNVVGIAGEGIISMHMLAQPAADQPGADREILVAAILAGPGFDIRRGGSRRRLGDIVIGGHGVAP